MEEKEKIALLRDMLELIAKGSHNMPNYVFTYYKNHNIPCRQKCFYNLIADSFLTLYSFSVLMNDSCWSQASVLLRVGLEQVAAVFVLTNIDGTLEKYIDLQCEKSNYYQLNKEEQKDYAKEHGFKGKENSYFDYGWIKEFTCDGSYGINQLLKLVGLEEFLVDIEQTLNSFAHGSITIFQFNGNNWEIMRKHGKRITIACCKLFDFLCCAYKKIVKDEFDNLPLNDIFIDFEMRYKYLFEMEGWNQ